MARYPLGQPVSIPVTVQQRNTDGTYSLVDAGTLTIVVKLAQADGTQTTTGTYASPTHDSTGKYHQDVPASDLTGLGHYQWAATSTGTGAGVTFGDFDVHDPYEPALLPLQDAKDVSNIPQATTTYDTELQSFIATIETSMEALTGGPLVNRIVTERAEFTPDLVCLTLRQRPIVSVTQIVSIPNGATVDISSGLDIDPYANVVYMKGGWAFPAFSPLATVTYVAGWGTQMPAAFNNAARIIIQHLWTSQHGPSARPSIGPPQDLMVVPGFGFAIPRMAAELLNGQLNGMPFRVEAFA
jgi:hypothetical protein